MLGLFLSPDNYVQAPGFSQSFNQYAYCMNNPLGYVDPSGEVFWIIPNIGWSSDGGLSIGITFSFGLPGSATAQVGIGYNFKTNDTYGYVGATLAMNTVYISFSSKSGLSMGYTVGASIYSGLPISTNFLTVGANYNISHDGWSVNMSAWYVNENSFSFSPSVSVMVFPERTTNLVRRGRFITHDAMLKRFVDVEDYQGALDYFGFEGTYDPENIIFRGGKDPGAVHPKTGEIFYNTTAFDGGFDKLYLVALHESKHSADVRSGKYNGIKLTEEMWNREEFYTWKYTYKNQGLYRRHGIDIESKLNLFGTAGGVDPNIIIMYSFKIYRPWWHIIYRVPRRW